MFRRRLVALVLAVAATMFARPGDSAAQAPIRVQGASIFRLGAPEGVPGVATTPPSLVRLPDSAGARRRDHTVTGLLIGAGVGFAAGWVFYDAICEAIDNRCSDSRVRLVLLGTAAGGGLGAIIGSLIPGR